MIGCCGCGPDPVPMTTALVIGNHSGAAPFSDSAGAPTAWVRDHTGDLASHPGSLTVVVNQGIPAAVGTATLTIDTSASWNVKSSEKANQAKIDGLLAKSHPTVEQASPVRALLMGADAVRGHSNATIVVFDNGLSTSSVDGILMQSGTVVTPDWNVTDSVAALAPLPSFKGISARWLGLCQVTPAQTPCPTWAIAKLKKFYTLLVTKNGGTISFNDQPVTAGAMPKLPTVDPVPFRQPTPPTHGPTIPSGPTTIQLDNDKIRFVPNTAHYAHPATAKTVISHVAATLSKGHYTRLDVEGCVNDDGSADAAAYKRLGRQRAHRVATDLRHAGVKISSAWSPGAACPGYVPGGGEANMRVIITAR